jgi:hypothetical protein
VSFTYSPTDPTLTQPAPPVPPPPETPRPRRARSLFWPGFAMGFLFLASLSCGVLSAALGLNRVTLADIQGSGPVWTPAATMVAPAVLLPSESAGAVAGVSTRFAAGASVRNLTNSRVNIRTTPGHLSKPATDTLGQVEPGGTLEILGESVYGDNLTWWRVRYQAPGGASLEGWVAEATGSGVQILGE